MRYRRQHVHLVSNKLSDGFAGLDRKIQNLIIGVTQNQNTFDELRDLVQAEHASSKQHVSQEFEKHHERSAAEDSYSRLLESLYFPDIHARQEGIAEAHKQTLEWIFDKPGSEVRPWDNFIEWLESGHGTYWISGKAGSGKSTLMSFICQDPRTEAALRVWSGTRDILMPKFFFWSPGTQLQKSLAGLLRSLVYQIMDGMPALANHISPTHHRLLQLPTWTEQRLGATLQHLLSDGLEGCCLCIFIDGLDEFHGSWITLLDRIRTLGQTTRVKFCLSSRPHRPFRDELGSSAMLKLQDLTGPDIRKYVYDKLDKAPLRAPQVSHPPFRLKATADTIVRKAEGVFLWVYLAVRDQLEGISNGDNAEQLRERLDLLPEEMEGLYGHILRGIGKVYRPEVAKYFHLVLHRKTPSLLHVALAVHKRIDEIVLFSPDISINDRCHHCKEIGERVVTTSKGFLEVREDINRKEWQKKVTESSNEGHYDFKILSKCNKLPVDQRDDLMEITFYQHHTGVNFLHRTAIEFLENNEQGKDFLKVHAPVNPHLQVLWVKVLLVVDFVPKISTGDVDTQERIESIMHAVSIAEGETGVAQPALVDLLDRCMTMLCQRSSGQPSNLHWCRAWGYPLRYGSSDAPSKTVPPLPLSTSRTRGTNGPSYDAIMTPYPVDLLGFAAWCGVRKYVEHILDLQSGLQNLRMTDYLLSCAVNGLAFRYTYDKNLLCHLELISALLNRGADPNKGTINGTVWGSFLPKIHVWCHAKLLSMGGFATPEILYTTWGDTARAFLQNGAHVNERTCYIARGEFPEIVHLLVNSEPISLYLYEISLHLSALSILQQCFAGSSDFSEFADNCKASGPSLHSECIALSLWGFQGEKITWAELKLPEQQLGQFSQFWDQLLRAPAGFNRDEAFKNRIMELYQEVDMQRQNDIKRLSDGSNNRAPDAHTFDAAAEGPSRSAHTSHRKDKTQ